MAKTLDESVGAILSVMGAMNQKNQRPSSFCIGQVTAGTEEGLKIQCGGLELTADQIWINEALLTGYSPKLAGTIHGICSSPGSTTDEVKKDDLTREEFALKAGDRVVLLTQDNQTYYLLCKAVKLTQ